MLSLSLSLSTTGALHCADPELCVRQVRTRSVSAKSHPLALRCRVRMVMTPLGASQLAWGCGRRTLIASAMRMARARAQSCRACGLALGATACSGKTQHPRPWRASDISRCMAMKPCVGQKPRPLKHRLHSIACIPSLAFHRLLPLLMLRAASHRLSFALTRPLELWVPSFACVLLLSSLSPTLSPPSRQPSLTLLPSLTPLFTSHLAPLTSHLAPRTSHLSPLTSHLSPPTEPKGRRQAGCSSSHGRSALLAAQSALRIPVHPSFRLGREHCSLGEE